MSQIFIVLSSDALAKVLSGNTSKNLTAEVWPFKVFITE
jgi:hypothetical protein